MKNYQLTIIGGGPAGMSCALAAKKAGIQDILLLERRNFLGGILRQCIHDGFGLLSCGSSLTGPEFARSLECRVRETDITIETGCFVSEINYEQSPFCIEYLSSNGTLCKCTSSALVIATGCREKPFGSLRIPGTRPSGIYSAGTAQYMMNVQNILPGKTAVILGLGDIGMIMARRLTLEGARVKMILGLEMTGLPRNFQRCIKDFDIPYAQNYTVVSVHGQKRLKGVTIAPLDDNKEPVLSEKKYLACDTLLVAAGLVPEKDLCPSCPTKGVFLCGNVDEIYSLVDYVVEEGEYTGLSAASYLLGSTPETELALKNLNRKRADRENEISSISTEDDIICCGCPRSCSLHVEIKETDQGSEILVSGNTCGFGEKYARSEFESKKRILTTTVKVKGDTLRLLPVRSSDALPLQKYEEAMQLIRKLEVEPDIPNGTVLIKNILRTGADIIVTQCDFQTPKESCRFPL